ncbi:MAG: GFA family protein [Hyphomicrobiaceae bacterium]|nr:GFA family protein [Hyphomicrobiaceae bacterium]MCC0024527.1 GFA family protein [Hyphomicrobiaceae bacterium]
MTKKTYHGSCICQGVQFEAEVDLAESGTKKCNCTRCWKLRAWSAPVAPENFRLVSGRDLLSGYAIGGRKELGGFCRRCGASVFGHVPKSEWNNAERYDISVAALDDLDPGDLISAPVTYYDGRHDNWWHAPAETRHL